MDTLISAGEAARLLGVTRATVHRFAKDGKFPIVTTLGIQKQVFFREADVRAFAEEYRKNSRAA